MKAYIKGFTIYLAVATIFTGIFGLCYQKGLIVGMNLGNLNGNYEVREIFNSAIFVYLDLLTRLKETDYIGIFLQNYYVVPGCTLIGLLFPWCYRKYRKIRPRKGSERTRRQARKIYYKLTTSHYWAGLWGFVLGLIGNFVGTLSVFLIWLILLVSLIPALLGYQAGIKKAEKVLSQLPCSRTVENLSSGDMVRQCTQLVIHGQHIEGDIMLENGNGYFLHLNKAFLYLSKDGKRCIYSKHENFDTSKDKNAYEFDRSEVDEICTRMT